MQVLQLISHAHGIAHYTVLHSAANNLITS